MEKIKVFIADDHPVFLKGLRMVIEDDSRLLIVGEAHDGNESLSQIRNIKPDVAVLDLNMPYKTGFEVVQELKEEDSEVKFIFLTMHDEEATFNSALDLGVGGYILKDSALSEINNAIKTIASGKSFVTPKLSNYLVHRVQSTKTFSPQVERLTVAEQKILRLIAEHKTTREIASELFVSTRTVDRHRYNICRKLNINGINSLLKFAIENKAKFA